MTAFQDSSTALYAVANSASDSQIYLEALGKGTDGVVLHTDDAAQIYALKAYLKGRSEATMGVRMVKALVTQVEPVGLGDRVCVDLCNLLQPGEGLLVSHQNHTHWLITCNLKSFYKFKNRFSFRQIRNVPYCTLGNDCER